MKHNQGILESELLNEFTKKIEEFLNNKNGWKKVLPKFLKSSELTSNEALEIFQDFFFNTIIKNFLREDDGDMALFQYGVFDWGQGESFEINFTRQLVFTEDKNGYEGTKQLSFTLFYPPTLFTKDQEYNTWYHDYVNKEEWIRKIKQTEGFIGTENLPALRYEIRYEVV